jgi:SM-20-related protein
MATSFLDLERFGAARLETEPFSYSVVPGFIRRDALHLINADYPDISRAGSFPLSQLRYGPAFRAFIDELQSVEFREAFEGKFEIDLAAKPTTITVRGRCAEKDGQIHTDSASKIITVLIYLNSIWEAPGGRLRLLRCGNDLEDTITEIPPIEGTLLAFKRAENSWHGHKPFVGVRRVIQFNWVTSEKDQRIAMLRHHASAAMKRMIAKLIPAHYLPEPRKALSNQRVAREPSASIASQKLNR